MNFNVLQKDAENVFAHLRKMGLLTELIYIKNLIDPVYDVKSGKEVITTTTSTFFGYIESFSKSELSNDVLMTDLKVSVIFKDMGTLPEIDDMIEKDGVDYRIISFIKNPADPIIVLQLRAS